MATKNFSLILWALTLCVSALAQKNNYQVSAIAFYNFENLFDTNDDPKNWGDNDFLPTGSYNYTEEIYRQKLYNLATVLKRIATDITPDGAAIIGAAEIENAKVLADLTQHSLIKDRGYKFIHFDSQDSRGIDVAMLYNPKYFKVLSAKTLNTDISRTGEKGGKTRDVLYVNGILLGDTINVFVNHWPSRRGGEATTASLRAIAANVNKRIIDSLTKINPRTKSIVMGDLNDDPTDASVAKVLGAIGDKNKVEITGLFNPFMSFYKKGIGTLSYDDRWNLFDQIIISGSFIHTRANEWKYYKAEVFNKEFLKNSFGQYKGYPHRSFDGNRWMNGYSDHFPTIVYLVKAVQ